MMERLIVLDPAHASAAITLSNAANWNQTEEDWRRVIELAPDGCFGIETDGDLVATSTTTCYGTKLAWIGMVLTRPDCRGRGYAHRLMERLIEHLEAHGVEWMKLDATDMGYPLYSRLGFADESVVERWLGTGRDFPVTAGAFAPDTALDLEAFGADRSVLLDRLAPLGAASVGSSYAMGRAGHVAHFFGPAVARDPCDAERGLQWFLSQHPGEPVYWDLLPSNREAAALARDYGFERKRQLVRMVRPGIPNPAPLVHNDSSVFAIAGFEYG